MSIYEIIQKVRHNIDKPFKNLEEATVSVGKAFDDVFKAIEQDENKEQAKENILRLISESIKLLWGLDEWMGWGGKDNGVHDTGTSGISQIGTT